MNLGQDPEQKILKIGLIFASLAEKYQYRYWYQLITAFLVQFCVCCKKMKIRVALLKPVKVFCKKRFFSLIPI